MYCKNCGGVINEESSFCDNCGAQVKETSQQSSPQKRDVPKCTCCGYQGTWKKGPLLRPIDFVIGIFLLLLGVIPGLVYIGVVALIRGTNDSAREKICPKCGAKNLWTFFY